MEISDSSMSSAIEKRRYPRLRVNVPVQYRNLKKIGDFPKAAISKNLGEGGVCFKTGEFMSLACRLVVELTVPTSPKPIKAITKIAWIKKLPAGDQYELGHQFLEMAKEDKALIVHFINSAVGATL